eukprot:3990961-Prymnesium_polylepis.2
MSKSAPCPSVSVPDDGEDVVAGPASGSPEQPASTLSKAGLAPAEQRRMFMQMQSSFKLKRRHTAPAHCFLMRAESSESLPSIG